MLLSQEKAKIRELGSDGPTPSVDDEIPISRFSKKNLNEDKCKGQNLKACQQKLGETTEFDSVSMNFPSSHLCCLTVATKSQGARAIRSERHRQKLLEEMVQDLMRPSWCCRNGEMTQVLRIYP